MRQSQRETPQVQPRERRDDPLSRKPPRAAAWIVGLLAFCVYAAAPGPSTSWDTVPTRLLPFSIAREGNLDLDEFGWLRRLGEPYFMKLSADGHWQSKYPVATAVLLSPLYPPAVQWLRAQGIEDDEVRFRAMALAMERLGAAALAALSVALVLLGVATMASPTTAVAVALVYAFGSNTWAITSSALWQHGLVQVTVAGLSLCLLRPDSRRTALGAGLFAGLGLAARPTAIVFAALGTLFLWRYRRSRLLWFLPPIVLLGGLVLAYNVSTLGSVRGGYRTPLQMLNLSTLLALLISPNRGLFVFTPAALLGIPAFLPHRRKVSPSRARSDAVAPTAPWLNWLATGVVVYWLGFAISRNWWGGFGYGPRFFCDVLPALALLAAPTAMSLWKTATGRAAVAALAAASVAIQIIGVYGDDGSWDSRPISVDDAPWRVWDVRDTQIGRALLAPWKAKPELLRLAGFLADSRPALLRELDGSQLRGELEIEEALPLQWRRGEKHILRVRLTNHSDTVWPAFSDYGYLNVAVVAVLEQSVSTANLPRNLGPGEFVDLEVRVEAPRRDGARELQLKLIQIRDVDAGAFGGTELRVPVQLRASE